MISSSYLTKRNIVIMALSPAKKIINLFTNLASQIYNLPNKTPKAIRDIVTKHWLEFWKDKSKLRFSTQSKEFFDSLRIVIKYHEIEKRDGAIVNKLLHNGAIIANKNQVDHLITNSPKQKFATSTTYPSKERQTPNCPNKEEIPEAMTILNSNKALSCDLIDDYITLPELDKNHSVNQKTLNNNKNPRTTNELALTLRHFDIQTRMHLTTTLINRETHQDEIEK